MRTRETAADQAVREMIIVALIEWLSDAPSEQDHPNEVSERDGENEEGCQHGEITRVKAGVEMREDGEHRQKVTDEVAARIAQKSACAGKVIRQKTKQGTDHQEGNERHEVLSAHRRDDGKVPGANGSQAGAKAVHVIHEIESINDGENPEHGHEVAKHEAGNKDGDAGAAGGHEKGDQGLTGEFDGRGKLVPVVEPADPQHPQGPEKNADELDGPAAEPMPEKKRGGWVEQAEVASVLIGGIGVEREETGGVVRVPQEQEGDAGKDARDHQASHDGKPARERDGPVMNLASARIIDQPDLEAPFAPERQADQHRGGAADDGHQIDVIGEAHQISGAASGLRLEAASGSWVQSQIQLMELVDHALHTETRLNKFLSLAAETLA